MPQPIGDHIQCDGVKVASKLILACFYCLLGCSKKSHAIWDIPQPMGDCIHFVQCKRVKVLFPDLVWRPGLPKILDLGYFLVLIWWQSDKKQEVLMQRCKDLFILAELIIFSALIVHNPQNR